MPRYSQRSMSRLSTCHPDLQVLFFEVIRHFDCTIVCGHRNQQDQAEAKMHGASKVDWPNSKHNTKPSMAVDVAPYPIDWMNYSRFYWFGGYVMGVAEMLRLNGKMTHKVRYGGDWDGDKDINDQTFNDLLHFELIGA